MGGGRFGPGQREDLSGEDPSAFHFSIGVESKSSNAGLPCVGSGVRRDLTGKISSWTGKFYRHGAMHNRRIWLSIGFVEG